MSLYLKGYAGYLELKKILRYLSVIDFESIGHKFGSDHYPF